MDTNRIEWDASLAMGHPVIDEQHRRLIALVARLGNGTGASGADALQQAIDYAASHFRAEEELMARAEYPYLPGHRAAHKELTRTLFAYAAEYRESGGDLYNFRHLMFRWVRDHILDDDRRFASYLAEEQREARRAARHESR